MALTLVSTGNQYKASDVNSILNLLQQPSGGQELGSYHAQYGTYAANAYITQNCRMLSQYSTPVSVSLDHSGGSNNCSTATAYGLAATGFQIEAYATAAGTTTSYGGGWTVQY